MPTPILATKLFVPSPRSHIISRSTLVDQLKGGLARKLTLISAPAGFGKTTLLSECVHHWGRPVAWISLDNGDNEQSRFLSYFISALKSVAEDGFGDGVQEALHASQAPNITYLLSALINEIVEIRKPFVMVLDDYHVITNPEIHEILTFLVENQAPTMHLVVSGRADPPWPLARWRARQEMIEVRTDDLRFAPEETAALLNDVMGLALSPHDVLRLDSKTEGWIAGLVMAAISMQGREDISDFVQAFEGSHRYIFDYLVEEVLDQLSPASRDFLLQTCILEQLCAPLCDTILGREDSQSVLQQFEQMNLFIFPLDDQRYWYRYHHLLSDLLTSRLKDLNPDKVSAIHRQASSWYESNDLLLEAVSHAFAAGDVERVAHLVETNVLKTMERGEIGMWIRWLDALPSDLMDAHPWLRVTQAWTLTQTGSFEEAIPCIVSAEAALRANPGLSKGKARHITGHIAAIRSCVETLSLGDYVWAAQLAEQALENLPQTDVRTRGTVTVLLGTIQRIQGEFDLALETLNSALVIYRVSDQPYVLIDVLSQIARLRREQGLLYESARVCQQALDIADHYARDKQYRLPVAAYAMGTLGRIFYEWNQLDKALEIGSQALGLSERWGQANTLLGNLLFIARVYRAQGRFQDALAYIQAAANIGSRFSESHEFVIKTHEMTVRLAMGEINSIEQWVRFERKAIDTHLGKGLWELAPLILALYRAKRISSLDQLLTALGRLFDEFESKGIKRRAVSAKILKAMACQAMMDYDQALTALEQAMSWAEPEGYIRSFLDQGPQMQDLLVKAIASGVKTDYASKLLSAFRSELPGKIPQDAKEIATYIEALTERETQVLRLLATELSIPEIADELVIAKGTLRTHIKRIYNKLSVHSRFEAVTRAKETRIL